MKHSRRKLCFKCCWRREFEEMQQAECLDCYAGVQDDGQQAVYKKADMHTTRFKDLQDLRVGYFPGYVYCHQGCCEHGLYFRDIRRIHPDDSHALSDYPIPIYQASSCTMSTQCPCLDMSTVTLSCDDCLCSISYRNIVCVGRLEVEALMGDISCNGQSRIDSNVCCMCRHRRGARSAVCVQQGLPSRSLMRIGSLQKHQRSGVANATRESTMRAQGN